jgi:hypothetical protein
MKRFALLVAIALVGSTSGCCMPWYGGYGMGGSPYGAGYPAGGGCYGGACGGYPGAYYGTPGMTAAAAPYGTYTAAAPYYPQTATLPLNYVAN